MTGPAWLSAVLAAMMLLIAVGSVARLAVWRLRGQAAEPEADALHVLMGVAMAGMFEPRISVGPDTAWRAVFAVAAAWFAWRAIRARSRKHPAGARRSRLHGWRCAHPAPHCIECAAMIYMLLPTGTGGQAAAMAMPGMVGAAPAANPALALVLTLFMLGYIVWTADRLASQSRARSALAARRPAGAEPDGSESAGTAGHGGTGAVLAPRAAACSKIAMCLAMGYMLLTML